MREIKFRAWFMLEKRMVEHENLNLEYGKNEGFSMAHDDLLDIATFNFDLMQYTGLKDKNGKEIYEGDAVYCAISSADRTHFIRDYTAVVEQDICNPCFVLKQENGEVEYDFVMCNLMILEVIGNIYENPEFLTEAE